MRKIKLQRVRDINGKSGIGDVWEGVEFSNGEVAGRWNCNISSHGTYSNIGVLEKIHGHGGATRVVESDLGKLINIVVQEGIKTVDEHPLVAQGYICTTGLLIITFVADINSVYFYDNLDEFLMIYGDKIKIEEYREYSNVDKLFQREKIFV